MHLLFKKLMKSNVGICIPLFFTAVQIGVFAKEPVVEARQEVTDESAPVLRVVADDGFCPMSFYDADGNLSGLNVELITMVANQLGMRLEFECGDWMTCRQNLEEGKADVILGLETFSNMQHVLKKVPVTTDQLNVYGENRIESIGALANKKVAVMARSVIMTIFDLQCEYVEYNTNSEILKAVENGEVDYGICHEAVAGKIIEKEDLNVVPGITIMNSFLSHMTHDIRTPNNGIMGMVEVIKKNRSDQNKVDECLDKIQKASGHLLDLLNDVMDIADWLTAIGHHYFKLKLKC